MSKPNLKTLINNIKSNKVSTKNISTNNEYGFNLNNKSNDRSKNLTDNISRRDNQNYRESATDSSKKHSKSPNITRFTNQIQPVVNSQKHSIPQQFRLNSNTIAEESEFNNFDLELKKKQISDIQEHKKNISDLPMSYSNFDTYNDESFREKNVVQNYLEHSEKKPRVKENPNLPKSKTKILLNKDKKISSEFASGVSNQRILSNKKKSKDRFSIEDQPHFPNNINDSNFSNNLIYKSQFSNNSNNNINNPSNPFKSRPNNPISNALEDREKKQRPSQLKNKKNNAKKNSSNKNNNNNFSVNNVNFNNHTLHPNSMRVSNASSKSGISFSNNINNLNNNFFINNQPSKNEIVKNNYLIDLLKESGKESNKTSNNKVVKMNTLTNNNNSGNSKHFLNNDFAGYDYNNDLDEDEDGKFLENNNNFYNKPENNNFYEDEAEVDFIDNDSFDNKEHMRKDYFYIAVEQSQKLLNSKNSSSNSNNLSPNFNMANEHKGSNDNHKLVNNDSLSLKENKKEKEFAESEIPRSESLLPKKNVKLNTKLSEENNKKRPSELPDGSKSDYQPHGRNQFFFEGKSASAGVYSNRNQGSNKDLLLFNLNNNNHNHTNNNNSINNSNNKIDLKNNTFAKDSSMYKEKDEGEGDLNSNISGKDFLKTLEIMKNYLKIEQKQFLEKQNEILKKNQEKDSEIARLKAENKSLKNQNLDLKTIIHKIFFTVKSYEAGELFREQKAEVIANQLVAENEYLRYICDNVIKTEIVNASKDQQIKDKAQIKEKLANERSTTESNILPDDEVDPKSKGLHKRQKTHFNILTCGSASVNTSVEGLVSNETSRNSIKSCTENEKTNENENTITNNQTEKASGDLFGLTLNEFKEEKKVRRIRIKIDEDKEKQIANNQNVKSHGASNNPGSTKNSSKQVYLFYRTPSNKENKKIDFSSVNFKPN